MIKDKKSIFIFAVITLLLLTTVLVNAGDLVLVVNDSIGDVSTLTTREVKRIYLGKTTKLGGIKVKPVGLSDGNPANDAFNVLIMEMDPIELKVHWIKEALKGGAKPPKSLRSSESLILHVKRQKGAIGYLISDVAEKSGLRIVKIK